MQDPLKRWRHSGQVRVLLPTIGTSTSPSSLEGTPDHSYSGRAQGDGCRKRRVSTYSADGELNGLSDWPSSAGSMTSVRHGTCQPDN